MISGRKGAQPHQAARVKALHTIGDLIFVQLLRRALGERAVVAAIALELHDKRQARALVKGKDLTQLWDRFRAYRQGGARQGPAPCSPQARRSRRSCALGRCREKRRACRREADAHPAPRRIRAGWRGERPQGSFPVRCRRCNAAAVGIAPMLQRRPARMVDTAVEKKEPDGEQKQCEKNNEL